MKGAIKKAYAGAFRGGKSTFARTADSILGSFAAYIIMGLILRGAGLRGMRAVFCTALVTAAAITVYAFVQSVRFDLFIHKKRRETRLAALRERLLLCSYEEFCAEARSCTGDCDALYAYQSAKPADTDVLLQFYRQAQERGEKRICVVSLCGFDDACTAFAAKLPTECVLKTADDIQSADEILSDEEADLRFYSEVYKKKEGFFPRFRKAKGAGGFFLCAACLLVSSVFVKYPLYYRIASGLCMWIGGYKLVRDKLLKNEK